MPTRFPFIFVLLSAPAALLGGCAGGYSENPFQEGSASSREIQVRVQNQNFNDATIWAVWEGGGRDRLGTVTGNSTQTFTTRHRSNVVRFEVDFLAGGGYMSESIPVGPGERLELRLRP